MNIIEKELRKEFKIIDKGYYESKNLNKLYFGISNQKEFQYFPIEFIKNKVRPIARIPFKLSKVFIDAGEEVLK